MIKICPEIVKWEIKIVREKKYRKKLGHNSKTIILTKLKNSNCDQTKKP